MIAKPVSPLRSLLGLVVGLAVALCVCPGCHGKSTSGSSSGPAAREDLEIAGSPVVPADAAPLAEPPPMPSDAAAAATEVAA
nr:hypothetical protein [Deltaproteobacteria bacterium]